VKAEWEVEMKIVHETSRSCLQVSEILEVHTCKGQIRKAIEVLDFLSHTFSAFMYLPDDLGPVHKPVCRPKQLSTRKLKHLYVTARTTQAIPGGTQSLSFHWMQMVGGSLQARRGHEAGCRLGAGHPNEFSAR
jgi:hypothetical protein